jgi:hypothetical protein
LEKLEWEKYRRMKYGERDRETEREGQRKREREYEIATIEEGELGKLFDIKPRMKYTKANQSLICSGVWSNAYDCYIWLLADNCVFQLGTVAVRWHCRCSVLLKAI